MRHKNSHGVYLLTDSFSLGFLESEFGDDTVTYLALDPRSPDGVSPVTDTLTDDLALAPQYSGTVALNYNRPVSFGLFSANVSAQYQGSTNSGVSLPIGYLDDRTLVGAMLMLSEIDLGSGYRDLKFRLWGKNLLDQEYFIGTVRQPSFDLLGLTGGVGTFGDPRSYGIILEYNYL